MIRTSMLKFLIAICALFWAAEPAMSQPVPPSPSAGVAASNAAPLVSDPDYSIGVGDIVEVVVVGSSDYNIRARISNDGSVLLPLIGPIKAAGEPTSALADKVGAALKKGGYFASPIVRVELVGIRSRYVTVLGNVGAPGLLALDRAYRLSEVLARVGGRSAAGADYVVVTPANGASKKYNISALAMGGPAEDPVVAAGDKIFVPAMESDVFYVNGEVRNPGAFPTEPNLSLRIALAKAGGLSENGSDRKVTVVRNGKTIKGASLDSVVEPGDVITVGARLF